MAKDIVDVALGEVGYTESGTNRTKYGQWYGMNGAMWCHMFVSWCANQAGVSTKIVPKTASTTTGMEWFKNKGQFKYKGKYTPKRGDIVYFKTGRSHVGIVEKVENGTLHTVEGNSSNKVAKRTYSLSESTLTGYGVPAYEYLNTSTGGTTTTSSSKSSENELAALKRLLDRKYPTEKAVKADVVETGKLPKANVVVTVKCNKKLYEIPVKDGLKIVWERKGTPGKLTFSAPFQKKYKVVEGNAVTVAVDGKNFFYGFIFSRKMSKDGMMDYTCYDQLRYLKNKDTLIYKNKTASQVIKGIAERFYLNCGKLADTKYKFSAIESNTTLFDIIQNALDETIDRSGIVYVLYDEVGKLRLKNIKDMKVNTCLVDEETGEDFTYQTTIDNNVYNQIKLIYENKDKGTYDLYVTRNQKKINKWGVLQYVDKISDPDIGKIKAKALLSFYSQKERTLTISGVIGNKKVRAGSLVPVLLDLKDMKIANYMMVEKVTHEFNNHQHKMDLVLSGGDFSA